MRWNPRAWSLVLLGAVLALPSSTAPAQSAAVLLSGQECEDPRGTSGVPLAQYLRPDGTLALPHEGIEGSIDPAGFQLVSGPGEEPRFEFAPAPGAPEAIGDDCWDARFPPGVMSGIVYCLAWDGANLYAGGAFQTAPGTVAYKVAKWNGANWSPLGGYMDGAVYALAWGGGSLYAGGTFTTPASYVAKWNGTTWSALGIGTSGTVRALAWDGSNLFAGGDFTAAGGTAANHIAKWNGTTWSALGSGTSGGGAAVLALVWGGGNLYVGGSFNTAGGITGYKIAKWDGSSWSALGTSVSSTVNTLAWDGTSLYAGGNFVNAGGGPVNYIARWSGTSWSALGTGMNSTVSALSWGSGGLYAGGSFTMAGGGVAVRIARWDGTAWSALDAGADGTVMALASGGSNLFAGGTFGSAGGVTANYIAQWNGTAWSTFDTAGQGMSGGAWPVLWNGTSVYTAGEFLKAGGVSASRIAQWDGTAWNALGTGMDQAVYALASDGSSLYAGGFFTSAGSVPNTAHIAKWDGSAWNALGLGINGSVYALAWGGSALFTGGSFSTADGSPAANIARWDGSAWSTLASGMNSTVKALEWGGGNLYAGGDFTTAGGAPINYIAKWDGSSWTALGSGTNGSVSALAWYGSTLVAAGSFTTAGGVPANGIARWDGANWAALGTGIIGAGSLAWDGTHLYAGGNFTVAGGVPANYIARWDGSNWSPLGSGFGTTLVSSMCRSLAWDGSALWAAGDFTIAGGNPSAYIARWTPPASISSAPLNQNTCVGGSASFGVTAAGSGLTYQWQEDSGGGFASLSDGGIYSGVLTATLSLAGVTVGMEGYLYRCVATGSCGPAATSNPATLTLTALSPVITGPSTGCDPVTLATDAFSSYQWNLGGLPIPGATAQTYQASVSGSYSVAVTDSNGCVGTSAPHVATVSPLPVAAITGPTSMCEGGSVTLDAGSGFASYAWSTGDTTQSITVSPASSTSYTVTVTDPSGCTATSAAHEVAVHAAPAITFPPENSSVCSGATVAFTVDASGWTLAYRWQVSNDYGANYSDLAEGAPYSGVTAPTLAVAPATPDLNGKFYRAVVMGGCAPAASSNGASLQVDGPYSPPVLTGITAVSACAQGGIQVAYAAASGASRHDLYRDDALAVTGYASGALYNPGDAGSHAYFIRAVAGSCSVDSSSSSFADAGAMPPGVAPLYLEASGSDLDIWWAQLDPSQVDFYEVMRAASPTGPFDTLVGTASGILDGIRVNLAGEPSPAYYKVRAVKGACRGSLD